MFRRRTSRSTDLDITLGPPLRITDTEQGECISEDDSFKENAQENENHATKPSAKPKHQVPPCFSLHKPLPPSNASREHKKAVSRAVSTCSSSLKEQVDAIDQKHCSIVSSPAAITHPSTTPRTKHQQQQQSSVHSTTPSLTKSFSNSSLDGGFGSFNNRKPIIVERKEIHKLCLIGRGGSSQVFKVLSGDGNLYALKEVYMKGSPPEIKQAYVNEIKLLKKLKGNPQIITLHGCSWDANEGVLRILLERGEMDLGELIRSRKSSSQPLRDDPLLLMFLWQQMLNSVKIIHNEGIIHNDLKPENFVCSGLQLKLIDFGIANKIEEEHTSIERDIRCGTASYMAPECIMTHNEADYFKIGRPSDVWSLGCILYQMIFHVTPFDHIKGKIHKFHAITDPSFTITFPDSHIGENTRDVIQKCLQREPKSRPTIEQLLKHNFIAKHVI